MTYDTTKPFTNEIRELNKKTWNNPYIDLREGYYTSFLKKHNGIEIDHTDGIGTKGILHWKQKTFKEAVTDALAMNINDLVMVGAKPFKAQVHLMLPEDDHAAILEIMRHFSFVCSHRRIAITGGETSIHEGWNGLEISVTMTGLVTEKISGVAQIKDRLVCIPSYGVHSNGFTLIRKLFWDSWEPWMTDSTRIYDHVILDRRLPIHAAMHITGGAWTKIAAILPPNSTAYLDEWDIPECFQRIYDKYVYWHKDDDIVPTMYKTFNMGVGLVLAVAAKDAEWIASVTGGFIGGEILASEGQKVVLETKLSDDKVCL